MFGVVIFFYSAYAMLEVVSVFPRVSGSILNKNSLGYSFFGMVNTIKRIFVVAYPPLLGWLSINGQDLFYVIFISYLIGSLSIVIIFLNRLYLINLFANMIHNYSLNNKMGVELFLKTSVMGGEVVGERGNKDYSISCKLVISSSWVYFIYGSSLFFVNIIGAMFDGYSSVIYQSVGLVNALGTLIMSFILDPKISSNFDNKKDIIKTQNSVILGQLLAMSVIGPMFMLAFWYVFN